MIAVLMDAGLAPFGDVAFMEQVFAALRDGTEQGRLSGQGAPRGWATIMGSSGSR